MAEDKVKKSHVAIGVFGGCALIVVIAIIFLYIGISKTGLIGKSDTFPEPTRVVNVEAGTIDSVKTDLVASALRSLKNGEAHVVVTEEMLTSLMRQDLAAAGEQEGLDLANAQIAILDGFLEVYVPLEKDGQKTALTMLVKPILENGDIHMEIEEARLGTLKAPGFITDIPENLINDGIKKQLDALDGSFELTTVLLTDGEMTLGGKISLKNIPGF
ncbi:hypothetical protein HQ524_02345 [Candidatus Uhrbacteria bacterium]|nr:hypothetical protein [Candidatus Uhrbacteria bacterium]